MMVVRQPAVAGHFYPGNKRELEATLTQLLKESLSLPKEEVKGVILPHAGYMYSGKVAAETLSLSELKSTLIILGPNHTGMGEPFSIMTQGSWLTPLGEVEIDSKLATAIVHQSRYLRNDTLAHRLEHSIEVLIPFLQFTKKKIKFVPIVASHADVSIYKSVAEDIVRGVLGCQMNDEVSFIASSDMTHYESQESAKSKDHYAIESIMALDAEELLKRVDSHHITMCGVVPVVIMLESVKRLGAKKASLVKYQTSGDVTGDYSSVVGYAGIKIV